MASQEDIKKEIGRLSKKIGDPLAFRNWAFVKGQTIDLTYATVNSCEEIATILYKKTIGATTTTVCTITLTYVAAIPGPGNNISNITAS